MPKRVFDGEGLWRFDKLSHVKPTWMRAELANLLPLSLANGFSRQIHDGSGRSSTATTGQKSHSRTLSRSSPNTTA